MAKSNFKRLPTSISPKRYHVTLQPNLIECTFKGVVEIDLEVKEIVSSITLNCSSLELTNVYLNQNGTKIPSITKLEPIEEIAIFSLAMPLGVGNAQLKIAFRGTLSDNLKGFYRNKYILNGRTKYGAATQFESTDARRCFPCWDEPSIKARFDAVLIVPSNLVSISNMPEISRKPFNRDGSLSRVIFDTTPIMSTYLLAFVVGEYDYVEQFAEGVLVRVYTPVGKKEQGNFALEVAAKCLAFFNKYFNINYPLPKLDLVALSDFALGAMENWGLITYRERLLLVDPLNTSFAVKQMVALSIAHEISHQWFGNLVTMEWWTHLWLNEGYATFTESLAVDDIFPEFNVWTQFIVDSFIPALELDCLHNSHPIEVPVGSPDEVNEIFDDISYQKGASVIKMLHNYLGPESFKAGMNLYLTRHQYSNTFTEDLWKALEDSSGKPVGDMMSGWTKQIGHPLITVTQSKENFRKLSFKQERFLLDRSKGGDGLWCVPISISCSSSPEKPIKEFSMDSPSCEVTLDLAADEWIKVNCGSAGFFRTNYSQEMLSKLLPAITSKCLPPIDRLNIIDDLFALTQGGYNSTTEILKLLPAYQDEVHYVVWSTICNCIQKLNQLLSHTPFHDLFRVYARNILQKISAKLGWDPKPGEDNLDKMLRSRVYGASGILGDESIIQEAQKRLASHMNGSAIIPADNRSFIYKTVASVANEDTFDHMLQLYDKAENQEEKMRIASSLGFTKDPKLIQRVLYFAMSKEVRYQDSIHVLRSLSYTKPGMTSLWEFIKLNVQEFKRRYEGTGLTIIFIKLTLGNFASTKMADDIETFFKENPIQCAERALQQTLEAIRLNAALLERDSKHIHEYLSTLK